MNGMREKMYNSINANRFDIFDEPANMHIKRSFFFYFDGHYILLYPM